MSGVATLRGLRTPPWTEFSTREMKWVVFGSTCQLFRELSPRALAVLDEARCRRLSPIPTIAPPPSLPGERPRSQARAAASMPPIAAAETVGTVIAAAMGGETAVRG